MPYTFLSDEWLTEVKALADEAGPEANAMPADLTLNLVVTGGPEGSGEQGGRPEQLGPALAPGRPASILVAAARSIAGAEDPAAAAEDLRAALWALSG